MNAVLQCLSNTKPLTVYLLEGSYKSEVSRANRMKGELVRAYASLIEQVWDPACPRCVWPDDLKHVVGKWAPHFKGYAQQDAQEFLVYFLDGLHEDLDLIRKKPPPREGTPEHEARLGVMERADIAWDMYLARCSSKIVDLFVGQLGSELTFEGCNHKSVTFEPFWDLSCPIPAAFARSGRRISDRFTAVRRSSQTSVGGQCTLMACVQEFCAPEVLDGDDMVTCDKCGVKHRSQKRYFIHRWPEILVVQIKRFSNTQRARRKISTEVVFPLTDLR